MGSSRSAGCCRSPRRPTTITSPSGAIRPGCRRGHRRDAELKIEVRRVFDENFRVYGVRKVWRQLQRRRLRCRPLHGGAADAGDGPSKGRSAASLVAPRVSDKAAPCPLDHVNRQFQAPAPNRLWVSDFTYVATWAGFVYVAFVIDAYARRIVGWRASRTAHAGFVLDALEQALHERRPVQGGGLIHHSRSGQPIRLDQIHRAPGRGRHRALGRQRRRSATTTRSPRPSTASTRPRSSTGAGPWRSFEAVEFATLEWVDWFNNRRLLEPIGNIPPAEAEATLPRHARATRHGRVTQTKWPPGNPARFSSSCLLW